MSTKEQKLREFISDTVLELMDKNEDVIAELIEGSGFIDAKTEQGRGHQQERMRRLYLVELAALLKSTLQ